MNAKVCTKCEKEKSLNEFYKAGKEAECKVCYNARVKLYLYPNPDAPWGQKSSPKRKAAQARYREKNREKIRAGQRAYVRNNLPKVLARTRKYQAAKKTSTLRWLTSADYKQMEGIYEDASRLTKETGIQHEVDHIVPLCGVEVSGLHVPWNLQIITQEANRRKYNKC